MTSISPKIRFVKGISLALKIAAIYFILGTIWILLSDKILGVLARDPTVLVKVAIVKGWFYVSVTALVLYVLISRGLSRIEQSGKEARLSEANYRELVESANSIIIRRDITGRIIFLNEFAQDFFGYSKDEILGRNVVGTIVPEFERSGRHLKELIEDIGKHPEQYTNNENENIRANGERVWIAWTNKPIRDEHGQIIEILCVGNDITARKQAEASLAESEQRFTLAMEATKDGLWDWNLQTGEVYYSPGYLAMLGYASGEVPADVDTWSDRIHPEDKDAALKANMDCIENRRDDFEVKFRMRAKNGAWRWIMGRGKAAGRDEKGRAIRMVGTHIDITELKRIEEALRESEARYRTVIENIQDIFYRTDQNGTLVMASTSAAATLGYDSLDEVLGRDIASYWLYPDEREKMLCSLRKDGVVRDYEVVIKKKDGSPLVVSITSSFHKDDHGNILGVEGVIRDITDRKRAEDALLRSQRQLADIIEFLPDATFVINTEGTVIAWNRAMEAMSEISKNEMIGKGDFEYSLPFYGSRRPLIIDLLSASEEKKMQYYDPVSTVGHTMIAETYAAETYGGKGAYLRGVATVLFDENGNAAGAIESVQDITERKLAEIALRESEERFSRIFLASPYISSISRVSDGQFIDVNDAFLNAFGWTREEVIGHNPVELGMWVNPEDRAKMVEIMQERGNIRDMPSQPRRKSGEIMDVLFSAEVIETAGQKYILSLVYDITERKRAKEEKEKLEAQLFQAQKMESVGRLAGGVAHDFNNMLGVIIGRAEMALQLDVSNDKLQRNLQEILKAGLRSADLTRQLLAFARKQTAIPQVLDLNDTISGMLKMLRRLIGEDIDMSWQPGLDLWKVKIDPSQMDQILANLMVNARDAISGVGAITMGTENVVIDASNRAETPEFISGQYILLTVSDTGTGMSKEVRENIFEPFFTTKELGKGTGLGLSTVYGIVKQNDGFIYVASELAKGTTFQIYLPRFEAENAQVSSEEITGKGPTGTETILLVEDDEAILNLSKTILQMLGYKVIAAHTPVYALHLFEEHPGDLHLLITDVVMPEMNGRELAEQLRAIRPDLKCLYMSGYTADLIAHRGILDEGVNFIQKPFRSDELAAKVRQVLDFL